MGTIVTARGSLSGEISEKIAQTAVQIAERVLRGVQLVPEAEQAGSGVTQPVLTAARPVVLSDYTRASLRLDNYPTLRGQQANGLADRVGCRTQDGCKGAIARQFLANGVFARVDITS
jgi:hypothetical protein